MSTNNDEKLLSITKDLHSRLKALSKKSNRTMRGMLASLIDKAEKE